MKSPGLPKNEALRLITLRSLKILETTPEARSVNLCRLAADVFDVPMAAISLIDEERQWFKASVGLDFKVTTRDESFCGHVVETGTPVTCLDALEHPWFCDNRMVLSDPFVRFYSGCPIVVPGTDHCLGTLCIVDTKPKRAFDEKKVAMLMSLAMQATELLCLEVQVQQQKAEQQVFLARMSHDLRTPLNGIMGHATLLSDATCPHMPTQLSGAVNSFSSCESHKTQTGEVRESANTILECATHMLHLVNGILDFTNVSSGGKMELQPKWFSLRSCLEAVFRIYEVDSHLAAKGLTIGYEMAIPDLIVETDQERMKQIIINLISNGLKFTDTGSVTLVVHNIVPNSDGGDERRLKFEVRDTGQGVDPEIASTIFKPFVKSDASVNQTGFGLGLANCQMLCKALGGSIWFNSVPSQGSSFFFDIDARTKPANPPGVLFHGKSVLIVGRDTTILQLVQGHCESLHIRTGLTRQLSRKRAEHYDAVLCSADQLPDFVLRVPVIQLPATGEQKSEKNETIKTGKIKIPDVSLGPVLRQGSLQRILQTLWDDPSLPVLDEHSLSPLSSDEEVPFTGLCALVVDDNRVNQRVLSGLLSRLGVNVAVAGNGLEAVEMAAIFEYNVVFMDIDMPVMDGLEATKQMKRMPNCPYIIECSANIGNSRASSPMDASISKPTLLENLRQVLAQYMADARSFSSDRLVRLSESLPEPPLPGFVVPPCPAIAKSKQQGLKDDVSSAAHTQVGTRSCLRIPCPRLWWGLD